MKSYEIKWCHMCEECHYWVKAAELTVGVAPT